MKKKLISILKYCKPIYSLYYYLGTWFLNLIKVFIKTDDKLILFNSFGGKSFNDSPKALYDAMIKDERFCGYRLVWAFQNPDQFSVPCGEKIKSDTLNYFITALKARCWITNSSLERGLGFRGKHTYFVNTWHGTPLKKMGSDLKKDNTSFASKNSWNMDLFTTQSEYESEIFTRVFQLKPGICEVLGLPRNDELSKATEQTKQEYRKKLGISEEKRVILYAPTFREYEKNSAMQCVFAPPVDFKNWSQSLGEDTVILIRAHYETVQAMNVVCDEQIRNVSDYPSINELMIASDILVSDYSSVFFDYSILERPMVCFAYDYDQYASERGMYFDIRSWMDWAESEEEILEILKVLIYGKAYQEAQDKTRKFKKQFVETSGFAVERVLDRIYKYCIMPRREVAKDKH